jgi:cadmium resistance transport/sequestration family protein
LIIYAERLYKEDALMLKIIITALVTYVATSVDEIPVLFMLYTKQSNKGRAKTITLSYFLGTFILIGLGLLGALGLGFIPQRWIIGLFGLVPLVIGIKVLINGEDDEEEEEGVKKSLQKYKLLWVQVLAITIGLGADDMGIYIPLFTTIKGGEILLMVLVFAICTAVLCKISYKLTSINKLTEFMERYERFIIGTVFTTIGILIMYECGTFSRFFAYSY